MRTFVDYSYKGANFRICCDKIDTIIQEIKRQRILLSDYIASHSRFKDALAPIQITEDAPRIVKQMNDASHKVGVGPMAAVAGVTAQFAAEVAMAEGVDEVIVENGGDIYLQSPESVTIGLYAGKSPLSGKLAFHVDVSLMPLSICSSSSKMGHSISFGDCDLVTVVAKDAALADAAATDGCNRIKKESDLNPVVERISHIPGIMGILAIKNDKIGLSGDLPELIKFSDPRFKNKITMDETSPHQIF